eukprot:6184652-Pleurochrysis_carterae.AAC.3
MPLGLQELCVGSKDVLVVVLAVPWSISIRVPTVRGHMRSGTQRLAGHEGSAPAALAAEDVSSRQPRLDVVAVWEVTQVAVAGVGLCAGGWAAAVACRLAA